VIQGYSESGATSDVDAALTAIHRNGQRIDRVLLDLVSLCELEVQFSRTDPVDSGESFALNYCLRDLFDSLGEQMEEQNSEMAGIARELHGADTDCDGASPTENRSAKLEARYSELRNEVRQAGIKPCHPAPRGLRSWVGRGWFPGWRR